MNSCARMRDVEVWFDESRAPQDLHQHMAKCQACREHLRFLEAARPVFRTVAEAASDRPVNVERFLTDFRERREQSQPIRFSPRWAFVSAAAAAFLVAMSLMSIFTPEDRAVDARSYVDSATSEIEGATTQTYHSDDGTAIVWVNVPEGDMW